ncbi:MAG TPA: hypothetical protein VGR28_09540 [Candidatus Thermoplasmatota archaeon]|jgi:hypothetical protein|nr:hypothetical protein [Candidatus Thermoplasmatota archaeon]
MRSSRTPAALLLTALVAGAGLLGTAAPARAADPCPPAHAELLVPAPGIAAWIGSLYFVPLPAMPAFVINTGALAPYQIHLCKIASWTVAYSVHLVPPSPNAGDLVFGTAAGKSSCTHETMDGPVALTLSSGGPPNILDQGPGVVTLTAIACDGTALADLQEIYLTPDPPLN